jgi:hypothetical protein
VSGDANGGECIGLNTNVPLFLFVLAFPPTPRTRIDRAWLNEKFWDAKGKGDPRRSEGQGSVVSEERMSGRKVAGRVGRMETRIKRMRQKSAKRTMDGRERWKMEEDAR